MLGYVMVKEKYGNIILVKSCAGKTISLVLKYKNRLLSREICVNNSEICDMN
jgi:hypothetical protein